MHKRLTGAAVAAMLVFMGFSGSAKADPYWQCVTFARMFSGIQIFGDAWTWWSKASEKYATGKAPQAGAVLVFKPNGKMKLGHVAVVSEVLTDRIIQITHANWGGSRGKVEKDVTLVDVSVRGDWSQVKVWYNPIGDMGTSVYPTYGFIYQAAKDATEKLASSQQDQASR
jgi:surface antigen